MHDFLLDLRHTLRALARRPAFTVTCIATLALGIGITTAMSAVVHRLLLAPLPFEHGDRLGYVWLTQEQGGMSIAPPLPVAEAWRESARSLEHVELYEFTSFTLSGRDVPEEISGARISPTLASSLGLQPLLGRSFTAEDARPGGERVVLLDEGEWQRRYGADPRVVGTSITLDDEPYTIIGVMPARLAAFDEFGANRSVWVPFVGGDETRTANVLVRLAPNVPAATAEAEMDAIAARLASERPMPGTWTARVLTPDDFLGSSTRRGLLILWPAVGFVLLIACANVAGLLLARGENRRHEMAVRVALGAGHARIARHIAAESLIISAAGGVLGLVVATWSLDLVQSVRPESLTALDAVAIEPVALAFTLGLAVLTGLMIGIGPALNGARGAAMSTMTGARSGAVTGASHSRARAVLVAGQIALSVVLLVGAGLLLRSIADLQRRDPGFEMSGLLTFSLRLPEARYGSEDARAAFHRETIEGIRNLPGVQSASLGSGVPPEFGALFGSIALEGSDAADAPRGAFPSAMVDAAFFETLRIPLLEGRTFEPGERGDVVVINEGMARKYWPGETAVGKRFRVSETGPLQLVIGVVGNIATWGLAAPPDREQLYFDASHGRDEVRIVVRSAGGDPTDLVPGVRAVLARLDDRIPMRDVSTVESLMAGSIARERFNTMLLGSFAAAALVLAVIGLYGLISYTVAQRTREIGIRMALGAAPRSVRAMVVRQSMALVTTGLGVGTIAAFWLVRVLESVLHGTTPRDPIAFAGAVLAITAAAAIASIMPARRASRVAPVIALREE